MLWHPEELEEDVAPIEDVVPIVFRLTCSGCTRSPHIRLNHLVEQCEDACRLVDSNFLQDIDAAVPRRWVQAQWEVQVLVL